MSTHSSLTECQRFWLEHLRACGSGSLKAYAEQHALAVWPRPDFLVRILSGKKP